MRRLIIASAAAFETNELLQNLGAQGIPATRICVGIGMTESAIIASRLCDLVAGRDVIFCCTGGVFGKFNSVEIYRADVVRFAPRDVRTGHGYLVKGSEPDMVMRSLPFAIQDCHVDASSSISLIPETEKHTNPTLETLEAYSVARAWLPVVNTFTCVVASTNAVGPDAHEQWKSNFKQAATKTAELVSIEINKLKSRWS